MSSLKPPIALGTTLDGLPCSCALDDIRSASVVGLRWSDFEATSIALYDLPAVLNVDALIRSAATKSVASTVAVTFMSSEYASVGVNWLAGLRRIGVESYIVIACDEDMSRVLEASHTPHLRAHLPPLDTSSQTGRNAVGFSAKAVTITALKFPVVRTLVHHSFNVVLSDVDAIWMRNPLPVLLNADTDVAFQRVVVLSEANRRVLGVCGMQWFRVLSSVASYGGCPR